MKSKPGKMTHGPARNTRPVLTVLIAIAAILTHFPQTTHADKYVPAINHITRTNPTTLNPEVVNTIYVDADLPRTCLGIYDPSEPQGQRCDKGAADAYTTLSEALDAMNGGGRILIRGGSYTEGPVVVTKGGDPENWLTISSFPGELPIFQTPGIATAIKVNAPYVIVDGLEVSGAVKKGIRVGFTSWVIVRNCIIHDGEEGVSIRMADHVLVDACTIYNTAHPIFPDTTSFIILRRNVFYDSVFSVDPGGTTFSVIEDNYFRFDQDNNIGPLKARRGNLTGGDDYGLIIRRNLILEGDKFNVLLASANGALLYHNTLYNFADVPHSRGLLYMQQDAIGENAGNIIKNNIFRQTHNSLINVNPDMFKWAVQQEIDYNLYHKTLDDGDYMGFPSGPTQQITYGLAEIQPPDGKWQRNTGFDVNSIIADPQLVNPALTSLPLTFSPQNTSPAVDQAGHLTTTTDAGTGTLLPVDNALYFIDGYGLVEGDWIRVGTNPAVRIAAVNYKRNTLTVEQAITWNTGDNVSLDYTGSGPDHGAIELNHPIVIGQAHGYERAFAGNLCGNGQIDDSETCDDANINNNDACLNTCRLNTCGDGSVYVDAEACDDGNSDCGDGCSTECEVEPDWVCFNLNPSTCAPVQSLPDFGSFQSCFTGTDGGVLPGCEGFDFEEDGDVDLPDYARSIFGIK